MTNIREKFTQFMDSFARLLNLKSSELRKIVKQNEEFIDAELDSVTESKEAIEAIEKYVSNEISSLEDKFKGLSDLFSKINSERSIRIDEMKMKITTPLKELIVVNDKKKKEVKNAKDAKNDLEKAKNHLERLKSKDIQKRSKKLTKAKQNYEELKNHYNRMKTKAELAKETFNNERIRIFKKILNDIISIEERLHKSIMNTVPEIKKRIKEVSKEEEISDNIDSETSSTQTGTEA